MHLWPMQIDNFCMPALEIGRYASSLFIKTRLRENHQRENVDHLLVYFHANQIHFYELVKGTYS